MSNRYGESLIKLYNEYKTADATGSELLVKLQTLWYKTKTQTALLKKVGESLDANYQASQHLLLSVLENKLEHTVHQLNGIIATKSEPARSKGIFLKRGSPRRVKCAILVKENLEKLLRELSDWHVLYDPLWYLLSRVHSPKIDQALTSWPNEGAIKLLASLRKSAKELGSPVNAPCRPISTNDFLEGRIPVKASSAKVAQIQGQNQSVIVDTMPLDPLMDAMGTSQSVVALARALSRMDPSTFGLLRGCGVINRINRYEFIFEIPDGLWWPASLRDLLTNDEPSLNMRLHMAKQLANSVLYLHTAGFVHKNIRPETILVFGHDRDEHKSTFLVGFEHFRGVKDSTFKTGVGPPEGELYRHPQRQGHDTARRYVMQDDIYSLGVCLLEIGLWESFVKQDEQGKSFVEFGGKASSGDWKVQTSSTNKTLFTLADEILPRSTGKRFSEVVKKCLTVLDTKSTWDQVSEKGTTEIDIGLEYIENILIQLHEIMI